MKQVILIWFLAFAAATAAGKTIKVIDNSDSGPIPYATAFSQAGTIAGIADDYGCLNDIADSDFPLTIKCLGYNDAVCNANMAEVRLEATTYELGELVVTPYGRPILHMLCYVREYLSGTVSGDTAQAYTERMVDIFHATEKVKKFKAPGEPRTLATRSYLRRVSNGTDSVFASNREMMTLSWLFEMPYEQISEPAEIRRGAKTATFDRDGARVSSRKSASLYIENIDHLAKKKGHKMSPNILKMVGMTMDITEMRASWAFKPNSNGSYNIGDVLYGTFNLDILARGKMFKKLLKAKSDMGLHMYIEIYPVQIEYLTVEDAREEVANPPAKTAFKSSPYAAPLSPAIRAMIDRANAQKKK